MTLEVAAAPNDATITALRTTLSPLRQVLERQPYLSGDQPYFADYVVFAQFQWATVCPIPLLALLATLILGALARDLGLDTCRDRNLCQAINPLLNCTIDAVL